MKIDKWEQFTLRLRSESKRTLKNNSSDGVSIVSAHIVIDSDGEPIVWVVKPGQRIEPSKDASKLIEQLTSIL